MDDIESRAHGAFRIVFVRDRVAEVGQNAVTEKPGDVAAVAPDRLAAELAVDSHDVEEILGEEAFAEASGVHQIGEHDGERTMLGCDRGRNLCGLPRALDEGGDFALEPAPLANGQTEL